MMMKKALISGAAAAVALMALGAPAQAQISTECHPTEASFYFSGGFLGNAQRCAGWNVGLNDSNNQSLVFGQMGVWGFANPYQEAKVEDPETAAGDAAGWGSASGGPISLGGTYTNFVLALKAGNNFSLYEFTGTADAFGWIIEADIVGGLSHFTIYDGTTTTVPEPGSLLLLGTGLLGMAALRRRREDVV